MEVARETSQRGNEIIGQCMKVECSYGTWMNGMDEGRDRDLYG
jgi:hypothetical protein